jgi:Protein of unknown function (DUF3631)
MTAPVFGSQPEQACTNSVEDVSAEIAEGVETPSTISMSTAALLEDCVAWVLRYAVVSNDQAVVLAAWILHTYVYEAAEITPYIHITAPERESGKSILMDTLVAVAAAPIQSEGMTAAALVRCIDMKKPTIFLDEMDTQLSSSKEFAEAIRGILNAGYRKGGTFHKCDGREHSLREFNVYCPKCFAGIGKLPETTASRSIAIEMRRKTSLEKVEAFRIREVRAAALPIRERIMTWKADGTEARLEKIRPPALDGLGNRNNDTCEPLLCIGELAGADWNTKLRKALTALLNADASKDNVSIGVMLLSDIRDIFCVLETDRISSADLARHLREIDGRPWADWSHGQGFMSRAE